MRLQGKVALVTGSSRGIGRRIALHLAREGADIVLTARTERPGDSRWPGTIAEAADEVRALGRRAMPLKADMGMRQEVERMCQKALEAFGRVDILVNNARYNGPDYFDPFLEMTIEQWERSVAVNLTAPFVACKMLVPHMVQRGGGVIVCMTSGAATRENPSMPGKGSTGLAYPVTKAALDRFVLALAKEVKPYNIPVVAVNPGFTRTEYVSLEGARYGYNADLAHSMDVPARTVLYLCTCPNPIWYSGKVIVAPEFVEEHCLA